MAETCHLVQDSRETNGYFSSTNSVKVRYNREITVKLLGTFGKHVYMTRLDT